MPSEQPDFSEFGDFRLDTKTPALWCRGELVTVSPKALKILVLLVLRRGEIVSRDELLEYVWGETFVEDANITYNISLLRKTPGLKTLIQTIPKSGYRFTGEIRDEPSATTTSQSPAVPTEAIVKRDRRLVVAIGIVAILLSAAIGLFYWSRSVANVRAQGPRNVKTLVVLPFQDEDRSKNETLGLGLTDSLIVRLGSLYRFRVRPYGTVEKFQKSKLDGVAFARKLQSDAVLLGSFRLKDGQLSVTARLVDTRDGKEFWNGAFDDSEANILSLQNKLVTQVAAAVLERLSDTDVAVLDRGLTKNTEAYRAYLRGRTIYERRVENGFQQILDEYQKAIAIDPTFALAYSGLADLFSRRGNGLSGSESIEAYRKAKAYTQKALQLDGNLAEGYASLGRIKRTGDWDHLGAETDFRRSLELDPDNVMALAWYAQLLSSVGRHDEALATINRAIELDPVTPAVNGVLFPVLEGRGDFDEGLRLSEEAYRFDKENANSRRSYATFLLHKQQHEKVIEIVEESSAKGRMPSHVALSLLISAHHKLGHTDRAAELLDELSKEAQTSSKHRYSLAVNFAEMGRFDDAMRELESCFLEHEERLLWMNTEPRFSELRSSSAFREMVAKIGLTK